ncbi:TPA: Bro-N domain-containing protein [Vibrio parahaemolyticus]|nr:hypothetical protein [Vibrio parahaemolyticus]HCG7550924.1 hypothetical protein [Vibrio parahaemolyticus]HCG7555823.1 hypothetical protein [Vibrio parahaemolyticus]
MTNSKENYKETTTSIMPFLSDTYGTVRTTTTENGEVLFIATDVAKALGYRDAEQFTRAVDDDEKDTIIYGTVRGDQSTSVLTEAGLYEGLMRSRKKKAKPFRKWISKEVIPSIRKRGMYIIGQNTVNPELLDGLAKAVRDNALPALREFDRITQHDHWYAVKNPERYKALQLQAISMVALEYDLPTSWVSKLATYGLNALEAQKMP